MRKNKLVAASLLLLFVLGGTLLPHQEVQAFVHPSAGDVLQMIANAIDSVSDTLTGVVTGIFVALLASSALLLTSAKLLDWAVGIPLTLNLTPGTSGYNSLVDSGFGFALGLVNIFILILFVIVAFSSILRLDAFGVRKSLPRLILVALLANFSMLLVGLFTDIAQVFFNSTGLATTGSITDSALQTMKSGVSETINWFTTFYGAWIAKATIPFAQIPGTIFIAYKVLDGLNGGALLQALFLVVLNTMLGFVFLLYALLFIVRVVVIWFLAIVAPLALAAYVLPATKKYWDQWLHALISWSFLGIVAFFLLGLGLNLFSAILGIHGASDSLIQPGGRGSATLFAGFYAYIFLAVYLFVAFQISRKFTPVGANAFLSAVGGIGKTAGLGAGSFAWRRLGKVFEKAGTAGRTKGQAMEAKAQEDMQLARAQGRIGGVLKAGLTRNLGRTMRLGGFGLELGSKEVTMRMVDKDEREFQQGLKEVGSRDSFAVFNMVNEELAKGKLANKNRILGLLNGVRNRGDGDDIETALEQGILKKELIGQTIKTGLRVGPPGFRPLLKSFFSQVMLHPEQYGFDATSTRDTTTDELTFTGRDAEFLAAQYKSLPTKYNAQDFQGDTIAPINFDMTTEEGRFFMRKIIKERGADFIGQIARRPRKPESIAAMQYIFKQGKHVEDGLGEQWLLDNNAEDVLRYLDSPGARSLGLGRGITRPQIEQIIAQAQFGKQTPEELRERKTQLETELEETSNRDARRRIEGQMERIDETLDVMGETVEELNQDVAEAQNKINQINVKQKDQRTVEDYRMRPVAERQLRDAQQELRRRGLARPVEGLAIPEPPAPLPEILQNMPSQLKASIVKGNRIAQTIKEMTQEMQKSLGGIRDTQTDFNAVLQTMENLQNQIAELNQQEQAGTLGPELRVQRDELSGKLQDLAQSRRNLGEEMQQQTETALKAKEAIEAKKVELEDVRQQIASPQEEYEAKTIRVQVEKRIRQRRRR